MASSRTDASMTAGAGHARCANGAACVGKASGGCGGASTYAGAVHASGGGGCGGGASMYAGAIHASGGDSVGEACTGHAGCCWNGDGAAHIEAKCGRVERAGGVRGAAVWPAGYEKQAGLFSLLTPNKTGGAARAGANARERTRARSIDLLSVNPTKSK